MVPINQNMLCLYILVALRLQVVHTKQFLERRDQICISSLFKKQKMEKTEQVRNEKLNGVQIELV